MTESVDQPSGFWTLSRPSKLSKRRNSDLHELHHKVFNIAVVGLSGVERDKGPIGIGKSCLCNRFVRSAADDYFTDHISVLSQSDFGGRVVNNDHWLYWGSVIKSCDGYDLAFNVIEQSEFVDDACFQPFKSGKTEPYFKRCANTKLVSAEKLMYICKNQLGIEKEYDQRYLPDGKFNVDGFLCLFDVSEVQGRNVDKQIEMTNLIMLNLMKTRKPIVFVTTKHDEANELLVAEAERLVNQRDYRGLIPIVETSAQGNVNVNMAFLVCAQLIDRTRAKIRVPSYFEAHKNHSELLNAASEAYLGLIRSSVTDYRISWQQVCIKLSHNPEFLQYTYLHGLDKATRVFKSHVNRLRDECLSQRVQIYLKSLPDILTELVPRNVTNNNVDNSEEASDCFNNSSPEAWETTKEQLKVHPLFNKYFVQTTPGVIWYETELLQSTDTRVPFDWLDSDEAYSLFRQRNLHFETEVMKQTTKDIFAQTLTSMKIPVGKPFIEVKHMFSGDSSLELLSDHELFEVYVEYQNNLLQQARADFQELLLENAGHLQHLTSSDKVIRQEDIKTINAILQHDERYQALDRFDQDRTLMMIRHLSFLHSQISEQCPSYPKCVEPEVERLLITKAKTLVNRYFESRPDKSSSSSYPQKACDLVIFGPRRPSQQLILALNVLNSRAPKSAQYQITFTVFDNADEIDTQIQRFRQSNTKPKGCFGIFTNQRSLDHVSFTLEKFLILNSQVQNDKNHFGSPPIVMLYAADITLDERTMLALENDGQQMADRFKCPFMNVTAIDQYRQHQQNNILTNDQDSSSQVMSECASLDYACVDAAFSVLKEAVSRRVCFMELYNNQDLIPRQAFNPDARILMCLLCGEPFSNELFLWKMFLDYEDCYVTSSKSICLKMKMEFGQEKFIEITITSYTHGALTYREELLHGFILVCSTQRKASLSVLDAFSFNIPCTPLLVMAIKSDLTDNLRTLLDENESSLLIEEAQVSARRLKGHFELFDIEKEQGTNSCSIHRIKNFLHNVIKRKPMIERAYELGDSDIPLATSSIFNEEPAAFDEMIPRRNEKLVDNVNDRTDIKKHTLSSNDLNEASNGTHEKNYSEGSESRELRLHSNRPLPRHPATRSMKSTNEDTLNTGVDQRSGPNELYTKRPLPPIPSLTASSLAERQYDLDRDAELPATNLQVGNSNSNRTESSAIGRNQASEETNESTSGDDTEDSTDQRHDRPKPGKLDLSQFNNITNAIGKLSVQPPTSMTNKISSSHASAQDTPSQESGFFKNRAKKTKSKTKESQPPTKQQDAKESDSKDRLVSFRSSKTKQIESTTGSSVIGFTSNLKNPSEQKQHRQQEISLVDKKKESLLPRRSSDDSNSYDTQQIQKLDTKDRSSRFKVGSSTAVKASSFGQTIGQKNQDVKAIDSESQPKPAPRSVAPQVGQPTHKPVSVASPAFAASSGAKRIGNPRQNHGRAVAPPQLPLNCSKYEDETCSSTSDIPTSTQNQTETATKNSFADEGAIDFSQSPIAQRLLKHSKDYKVSELNSPYESDNDYPQAVNLLRAQKISRGQSLGSESANSSPGGQFINSSIDSSELINSRGAAIRQLNEILANKQPLGRLGGPQHHLSKSSSLDQEQQQLGSASSVSGQPVASKKSEKDTKKEKKKLRDDEKLEKRRLKEEERLRRQEQKMAAKKSKSSSATSVGDDGIPLFIKCCIEFIEFEGLDAEGIYRVPGNRAHVDAFVAKFKENPDMSIAESDIPVNAVATALKDFLSKKWGPIIPLNLMNELTELANISERGQRVQAVRQLVNKLPSANYKLLKYVFSHFVKVSLNHSLNSMDSKNLAICWWPTLLPLHFSDMVMFEQMRPHLEESIQTMIDQYDFIFDSDEPETPIALK